MTQKFILPPTLKSRPLLPKVNPSLCSWVQCDSQQTIMWGDIWRYWKHFNVSFQVLASSLTIELSQMSSLDYMTFVCRVSGLVTVYSTTTFYYVAEYFVVCIFNSKIENVHFHSDVPVRLQDQAGKTILQNTTANMQNLISGPAFSCLLKMCILRC